MGHGLRALRNGVLASVLSETTWKTHESPPFSRLNLKAITPNVPSTVKLVTGRLIDFVLATADIADAVHLLNRT
jgi:hypothetical protein